MLNNTLLSNDQNDNKISFRLYFKKHGKCPLHFYTISRAPTFLEKHENRGNDVNFEMAQKCGNLTGIL